MLYALMFIIGAQPSHSIVNTNPAELASHVGYQVFQVPETTDADTDNEALSKTIQKLRRDLVVENLKNANTGRSHRSGEAKSKLKLVIDKSKKLLNLPDDYVVGIMPGSDTGALEASLWSLLGLRGVDILAWENFGKDWVQDVVKQLKL